jgi:hypothetical protein
LKNAFITEKIPLTGCLSTSSYYPRCFRIENPQCRSGAKARISNPKELVPTAIIDIIATNAYTLPDNRYYE